MQFLYLYFLLNEINGKCTKVKLGTLFKQDYGSFPHFQVRNAEVGLNYSRINICRGTWDTTADIIFPFPFFHQKKIKTTIAFPRFSKREKTYREMDYVRSDKDVIFLVTHSAAVLITSSLC